MNAENKKPDPLYFTKAERSYIYGLVSNQAKELFNFKKDLKKYPDIKPPLLEEYLEEEGKKCVIICQKLVKSRPDS